jgi:hypothetical protein
MRYGRFRYTAERLRKSENVIEKYRKKLEDSAGLRKELRVRTNHHMVSYSKADPGPNRASKKKTPLWSIPNPH